MVLVEEQHLERAERGETELSVVVVSYDGPRHSKAVDTMRDDAHWPGRAPIVDNVGYVALMMDEGLGRLEAMNDVSVSYAPEDIAKAESVTCSEVFPSTPGNGFHCQCFHIHFFQLIKATFSFVNKIPLV